MKVNPTLLTALVATSLLLNLANLALTVRQLRATGGLPPRPPGGSGSVLA